MKPDDLTPGMEVTIRATVHEVRGAVTTVSLLDDAGRLDAPTQVWTRYLQPSEAQVRAEERERCCRAVCYWCYRQFPVSTKGDGMWWHSIDGMPQMCRAERIRADVTEDPPAQKPEESNADSA